MSKSKLENRKMVILPEHCRITIGQHYKDFSLALKEIDIYAQAKEKMLVDMASVKQLKAEPALLLFAYITDAQMSTGLNDIVKIVLPKDREVRRLIKASGLWATIKMGTDRKLDKNWQINNHFQSGYEPDKHLDLTLGALEKEYGIIPNKLGIAINEAILNISQHAYEAGILTRWWQYIFMKPAFN
ncbi:MAG: hypothetical protein ACI8WB_005673 [Phenylobacterium sp.]|jgi:hypothetical protein